MITTFTHLPCQPWFALVRPVYGAYYAFDKIWTAGFAPTSSLETQNMRQMVSNPRAHILLRVKTPCRRPSMSV